MVAKNKKVPQQEGTNPEPVPPVVSLSAVKRPLVAEGDTIKVGHATLVRHVGQLSVISNSVRATLTADQHEVFDDVMFELRQLERPLVRVTTMAEFLNGPEQFTRLVNSTGDRASQELRAMGVALSEEELAAVRAFTQVRAKVEQFFKALGPAYAFTERTGNEERLVVTGNSVTNGRHTITNKQAHNIFKRAYAAWMGDPDDGKGSIRTDWETRRIVVHEDRVCIGCQTVTRWQVEQLALQLGWIG